MESANRGFIDRRILMAAIFVLGWRIAAAFSPYREGRLGSMMSDPPEVRLMLAALGLVFVVCGLWVHARRKDAPARCFSLYALSAGLHWGGPIATSPPALETTLVLFYFVVGDLLGVTFLVLFAMHYTSTRTTGTRTTGTETTGSARWQRLVYTPVALATGLGALLVSAPEEGPLWQALLPLLPAMFLFSLLLSLLFLGLMLYRALRPLTAGPSRRRLLLVAGTFVLPSLPSLLGAPDIYNLGFLLVPVLTTYVLLNDRTHSERRASIGSTSGA